MNHRKLSELQKEYRAFFLEKMSRYGVSSPAELTKEKKRVFFSEIKIDWLKYKLLKKQIVLKKERTEKENKTQHYNQKHSEKKIQRQIQGAPKKELIKKIIKSKSNPDQTNDLRIMFNPNSNFAQNNHYFYPVVKMPKKNCLLKLPRDGRTNQKGYKENDFYNQIKAEIPQIDMTKNVHMIIPNFNKPYEPDIVLFDKSLNLYIDIEIDEPYDGYYRYPTHYVDPEEDVKKDNIRDLFFTESGWVVIRFSEKQVHYQPKECIDYIKNILNSIYNKQFDTKAKCEIENQWDYNQCIQWQKTYYREKYLGIEGFQKQYSSTEIEINSEEIESIESKIKRTKLFRGNIWNSNIAFDEESHKYIHSKDETGNAEYLSVTTLIERFFPFNLNRYIEKKAQDENRTEEDVLDEYLIIRDEATDKGSYLHKQIENFLNGNLYDSDSIEFQYFLDFYDLEIKKRNLSFHEAEKMIFSNKHNIAGTIDCIFKKYNNNEYVMFDWKRSKKLIIDGQPRIYGYGYALSELSSLDNSSYFRYCLQQNIYKYILETEFCLKISSMQLVVLHENYSKYHVVRVPDMKKEINIILKSLKLKI